VKRRRMGNGVNRLNLQYQFMGDEANKRVGFLCSFVLFGLFFRLAKLFSKRFASVFEIIPEILNEN
jgi:hypothetical protein